MILSSELAGDTGKILMVLQSYNLENLLQLSKNCGIIVDNKITAEELRLSIINQFYSLRLLGYTISIMPDCMLFPHEEQLYIVQDSEVWGYGIQVVSSLVRGWYQEVNVIDLYLECIKRDTYFGRLEPVGISYLSALFDPVKHIIYVTDRDDFIRGRLCSRTEAVRIKRKILYN